jgi:hypothetical protein
MLNQTQYMLVTQQKNLRINERLFSYLTKDTNE